MSEFRATGMDIERVHPTLRDRIGKMRALPMDKRVNRLLGRVGPRFIRWQRAAGVGISSAKLGGVRVRAYRPDAVTSPAALLWVHGGGMVIGAPAMDDLLLTEAASTLGIHVFSVDYRLPPEHPFPTPLDDCMSAWTGLVASAGQLGLERRRLAVGGQSAGGGLAAALAQRIRDAGGVQPVAQLLMCPMLDDRTAADRRRDSINNFVWNNASNRYGWSALLGQQPGAPSLPPYAAPARTADLAGLPTTWIGVGDIDLFHDEDVAYAKRLVDVGVHVTIDVVQGAPHGFESLVQDAAISREYRARAIAWLGTTLTPPQ